MTLLNVVSSNSISQVQPPWQFNAVPDFSFKHRDSIKHHTHLVVFSFPYMKYPFTAWLYCSRVLNRFSLTTHILKTCKSRGLDCTTSRSLAHTDPSLEESQVPGQETSGQNQEMAHLQANGAGRGTPNQNLSPDTPSFTPAPRGRGRGGGFRRNGIPLTDATMIAELSRETLSHMFTAEETKITDFEHLASYNWLNERNPTIAVPGKCSSLVEVDSD